MPKTPHHTQCFVIGLIGLSSGVFCPLTAAASNESGSKGLAQNTPLAEIVVVATRRESILEDISTNIAALKASEVTFLKADHASEMLNRLPGLNVQRGNGQEHLTAIRSPVLTGGAGAGSFLYLEDGVPLRAAGFANVNGLFEAHTEMAGGIEVVRGPGSAFYGSNAVHGLINVRPQDPGSERKSDFGEIETSIGSFGRGQVNGLAHGALGQTGYTSAITLTHEDGYRHNAGLDQQKVTLHLKRKQKDKIAFILSGHNLNQETAGFIRGHDAYKQSQLSRMNPNPEAFRDAKALRAQLRYDTEIHSDLTVSITPFARWNEMKFLMHFLPSKALEENGHKSVGALTTLNWRLPNDSLFILGTDVEWTDGYLKETQSLPDIGSFVQGAHYDYDVNALVGALYAHGEWQATDRLRLVAGLRIEATRYDYTNNLLANIVSRFQRPADRTDDFVTVTPKLGLVYKLGNDNVLFANYAKGARAPQTTDLYRIQRFQDVGTIEEEELDSIELGARGQLLGITYEATAYAMKKRNFFFRDGDGFNVTNGKTNHWGAELAAGIDLFDELSLQTSIAYGRHTYDFTNLASGVMDGNDVDTAPRWSGNVRLAWVPTEQFRAELEWVHMGRYYTDAANAHSYPGHDLINLRANWEVTDDVSVFGAVRNLTNTDYAERADFAFGSERYFPGEDRAWEIGVKVSF